MIRVRTLNGKKVFYESTTGVVLDSIKAVGFTGYPEIIVTIVYKDGVPSVYLPFKAGNPLVTLQTAIENMELIITKVA